MHTKKRKDPLREYKALARKFQRAFRHYTNVGEGWDEKTFLSETGQDILNRWFFRWVQLYKQFDRFPGRDHMT